jgi:RNA polymerase primary sigma factor
MIDALAQSPLTAKKLFEWQEQLSKNELLVREIIDIDSTYIDYESEGGTSKSSKTKSLEKEQADSKLDKDKDKDKDKVGKEDDQNQKYADEDEFNPSLAAMEEEIRPQVILTIDGLCKNYNKLVKYQNEKLNFTLEGKIFSRAKEIGYKKIQNELVEKIKKLQINPSVLEDLVQSHYQESKKVISLDGLLMRSAIENKGDC